MPTNRPEHEPAATAAATQAVAEPAAPIAGLAAGPRLIEALGYEELGAILRAEGFEPEPARANDRTTWRCQGGTTFLASLRSESATHPGQYELVALTLYTALPPGVMVPVVAELSRSLQFARAQVDDEGDLAVLLPIFVGGGVTAAHLGRMFEFWRLTLAHVREVILRHWQKQDPRALH